MEKIKKLADKVDGWLTDNEGELLYNTAKNCKGNSGAIVEVGSWKGKSTIYLGKGSKAGNHVKVYAIDPHIGSPELKEIFGDNIWTFEEFKENIKTAEVDDIVVPINKTSVEAAETFQEPIEFLFIDGDHNYEMVKLDFELWFPMVIEGGIIAFHDSGAHGPKRVINQNVYKSKNFKNIGIVDSILFAQKVKENSINDRLWNRTLLFFDKCAIVYHKLPFPKPTTNFRKKLEKIY